MVKKIGLVNVLLLFSFFTVAVFAEAPLDAEVSGDIYNIQPGDTLNIKVQGESDLTGAFLVTSSGRFTYPLLGEVKAAGLSLEELKSYLVEGLGADYLVNPQVEVDFSESSSKSISVLGEVAKPGNYPLTPNLSFAKLLPQLGGFTANAITNKIRISRVGKEGKRRFIEADADGILRGATDDVRLYPGDIIFVDRVATPEKKVEGKGSSVTILGQVVKPGNYEIGEGATLMQLIGTIGGFTPTASLGSVRVVRKGKEGKGTQVFGVDAGAILSGRAEDFKLQAGDLITVDESFF